MTLTKTDQKKLKSVEKALDKDIKQQYRDGLAKTFDVIGLKGIAREIKAGRNVRSNVILGIQTLHSGPRYDLSTKEVVPQSKRSRELEHKLISKLNEGLVRAGETPFIKENIIKALREKDRASEKRMRDRK
jgi:hypothetical protein